MAIIKTVGKIHFDKEENKWIITEALPHVCIKLKAIFNKIPKTGVVPFYFQNTPESCTDLSWFMERYVFVISEEDRNKLNNGNKIHSDTINAMEEILLPDYKPKTFLLNKPHKARKYQLQANELHLKCLRFLLADDLGLGKTLTGILSFLSLGSCPAIVVCQTHLTTHWSKEITKYTNLKTHIIKTKRAYDLPKADIYIFSYSKLGGWVSLFGTKYFKAAVFDEVQELRCTGTDKYNAADVLSNNVNKVMALSATPIYNYGNEIFNILNLIKPDCLGNYYDFIREWCHNGKVVDNPKALGSYLRDNFLMLRRTRLDVGMELPKINTIIHEVEYDHDEVKKQEDLLRSLAIKVTTGSFTERGEASRELDMLIRHMTGVSKARYVAAYVRMLLDNGEPVLLGGWHRDVYDIWAEELKEYNPVFYTGSETPKRKDGNKELFISGQTNLMIMSLRSGIGVDGLQERCSTVVYGELDWSPKVHEQFTGRIDRPGQPSPVTVIYLVSNEGSDPPILDMLGLKASQSTGIVDPLTAILSQSSDDSRIKKLAEAVLIKHKTKELV